MIDMEKVLKIIKNKIMNRGNINHYRLIKSDKKQWPNSGVCENCDQSKITVRLLIEK